MCPEESNVKWCRSICLSSDGMNRPLHLISSSEQQGSNLLKVEFIKVSTVQSLKAVQSTVHRVG